MAAALVPGIASSQSVANPASGAAYVPGQVLVKYRDNRAVAQVHLGLKASVARELPHGVQQVRLPNSLSVVEAVSRYRADPAVEYAEPNYIVRKARVPNDTLYSHQWALPKIAAPAAWDATTGNSGVIVAVLDTGMDYRHVDLVANRWVNAGEVAGDGLDNDQNGIVDDVFGASFKNGIGAGDPMDDDARDAHGTHVAGIVGAVGDNGEGVSGVAWRVTLMPVKVLHGAEGDGNTADIALGIDYAIAHGAKVLNFSLGTPVYSRTLFDALARADAAGVLAVSAAGNDTQNLDEEDVSPAGLNNPNNIAVAASDFDDSLAGYSNYGRASVHVAAPGGDVQAIYSTVSAEVAGTNAPYRSLVGTSMAAPYVAGLAVLIWSQYPALTHYQVKARILNGVDRITSGGVHDGTVTTGRINAASSLAPSLADMAAVFDVQPRAVDRGGEVVITGLDFGAAQTNATLNNTVVTTLPVLSWDAGGTRVTARIPLCSRSGYIQVSNSRANHWVDINPVAVSLQGTTSAVVGRSVALTATVSGAAGPVEYAWDLATGSFLVYPGATTTQSVTFNAVGRYTVRVRATDICGDTVVAALQVAVSEPAAPSKDKCFLASAAAGGALEPRLGALRAVRDAYLQPYALGRAAVSVYYRISPRLVSWLHASPSFKRAVVGLLAPVVVGAEQVLAWSDRPPAAAQPRVARPGADYVPGEVLLKFRPGQTSMQRALFLSTQRLVQLEYLEGVQVYRCRVPDGEAVPAAAQRLSKLPEVEYAEPNYIAHTQ